VTNKGEWPEERQLSVLQRESPEDYDLRAYLELTNIRAMNRITQDEVDAFLNNENMQSMPAKVGRKQFL